MENNRIVIVDDSAFSIAFIKEILESNGYEVVGTAGTLDEVKEVVRDTMPNLVTMDMTLPGTDGLECTRAVHEIDRDIKVIVISSMMDEEIVKQAKKNRVSAYVQKPIDDMELINAIKRILGAEELYQFLQAEHAKVFKESLLDGMNKMIKTLLKFTEEYVGANEYQSDGVTVIIGMIGKFSGRMLLCVSAETASAMAAAALKREPKSKAELTAFLGELSNIISGNACSVVNKMNSALGLRVSPPSILYGKNMQISPPGFTTTTLKADTIYGKLLFNVGFKRGDDVWM